MNRYGQALLLILISSALTSASADEEPVSMLSPAAAVDRVSAAMDIVSKKHVQPPARSQMAVSFVTAITTIPAAVDFFEDSATDEDVRTRLIEICEQESQDGLIREEFVNDAIQSMLRSVPGVRTERIEDQRVNQQLAENRYVGIGISLRMDRDQVPQMMKVFPGGPAGDAGAKDGDRIEAIDGKPTKGQGLPEIVGLLRGESGSKVEVTLRQPEETTERTYTLTRGVVRIASIDPPMFTEDQSLALISITRISSSTGRELQLVERDLPESVRTVVLEFRGQNSFDLHLAKLLANSLLDGGPIGIVKRGNNQRLETAERGRVFRGRQLAVLVSQDTLGAAEWIAAALQDQNVAVILGKPTAGAAFVEESIAFENAFNIRVPTAALLRADGRSLQGERPLSDSLNLRDAELVATEQGAQRAFLASRRKIKEQQAERGQAAANCVVPDVPLGEPGRVVRISPNSLQKSLKAANVSEESQ